MSVLRINMGEIDLDKYDKVHELLSELGELEMAFEVLRLKTKRREKLYEELRECKCAGSNAACGGHN